MTQEEGPLDRKQSRIEPRALLSLKRERNASTITSQKNEKTDDKKKKTERKENDGERSRRDMRKKTKCENADVRTQQDRIESGRCCRLIMRASLSFCLPGTAETDAVQALLARYLQRRLQGSQLSTPPPPSVLFSNDHRARVRQATQRGPPSNSLVSRNVSDNDRDHRPVPEDYDDYEDDLEGYEDSEGSRTRFDLLAGKSRLILNSN